MQKPSYKLGQSYLLRLPPGEDLLVGLYRVCREFGIECGVFQVIGTVRSATLGHHDLENGELKRQVLDRGLDLAQCTGNVTPQGDSIFMRAYAVVSDVEGRVWAGELLAAEIYVAEVLIQELKGRPPKRVRDPETDLWLWPVT